MRRGLAALLALALLPVCAEAASTPRSALFDFEDFPPPMGLGPDVQTYEYDCQGKGFCTFDDVHELTSGSNYSGTLATTQNGITATFSGRVLEVWGFHQPDPEPHLNGGNFSRVFYWNADFDVALSRVQLDVPSATPDVPEEDIVGLRVGIELWSGLGGTGSLVNSEVLLPGDPHLGFTIAAPPGSVFRSFRVGRYVPGRPECVAPLFPVGCPDFGNYNNGVLDNIYVTEAPEPGAAGLVFVLAAVIYASAARTGSSTA